MISYIIFFNNDKLFFLAKKIMLHYIIFVGRLGPRVDYLFIYIEPMTQAEDERLSKEDKSLSKEVMLVSKKVSFGHNDLIGWAEDKCILG